MGDQSPDPPFEITYKDLLDKHDTLENNFSELPVMEERELPLIDLKQLGLGDFQRQACKKLIAQASKEWGFFQVINHGISREILEIMRAEQVEVFKKPYHEKKTYKDLNFSPGSYRWGTPSATCIKQLSWSEAFHVLLTDIYGSPSLDTISSIMEQFSTSVSEIAQQLADILAEEMGRGETGFFKETCVPTSCYLRLNRYPACPIYNRMMGIIAHTDSDFLTVLHQDNVGGLQLVKDGTWIPVKPNPEALVVNIGDLFQAWSNDVYKSVEHRVVSNGVNDRFSTAYFLCPSVETVIEGGEDDESSVYRSFSFGEYKKQVKDDVQMLGYKVGLSRFLV